MSSNGDGVFFRMEPDAMGQNSFAPAAAAYINIKVIGTTASSVTVPNGYRFVLFSANQDFYVSWKNTAVVPTVDVTDGTGSELNPTIRDVSHLTTFSIIGSAASTIITLAFYK